MARGLRQVPRAGVDRMKKKAKKIAYFRHGDVHLVSIDKIPEGGTVEKTRDVEKGELTGHAHRLMFRHDEGGGRGITARIISAPDGKRYLEVKEPTDLTHEEHHTRTIPPGNYEIRRTRETDHMVGVTRQVAD